MFCDEYILESGCSFLGTATKGIQYTWPSTPNPPFCCKKVKASIAKENVKLTPIISHDYNYEPIILKTSQNQQNIEYYRAWGTNRKSFSTGERRERESAEAVSLLDLSINILLLGKETIYRTYIYIYIFINNKKILFPSVDLAPPLCHRNSFLITS